MSNHNQQKALTEAEMEALCSNLEALMKEDMPEKESLVILTNFSDFCDFKEIMLTTHTHTHTRTHTHTHI